MAGPADNNLRYSAQHCWVRAEGDDDTVRVGITDYAQQELGDVVYVDMPVAGSSCIAGERCATIESVKTASDVYAPLSGKVLEVNTALESEPERINQSPYDLGWLFLMRVNDVDHMRQLMDAAAYEKNMET